jgi:hypothetical protein
MADANRGRRGNWYTPAADIAAVPGLKHTIGKGCHDVYEGSAEAIVASGLATLDMLPGQPGRAAVAVSYRPIGVENEGPNCWFKVPGYITIQRSVRGHLTARLTVSREEQETRERARQARWESDREPQEPQAERRDWLATALDIYFGLSADQRREFDRRVRSAVPQRPRAATHLRLAWSAPAQVNDA